MFCCNNIDESINNKHLQCFIKLYNPNINEEIREINNLEEMMSIKIIKNDLVEFLEYLYNVNYEWNKYEIYKAAEGHLECLKFFFKISKNTIFKNYIDGSICTESAALGSLDCLKYAHENGCKLSTGSFWWTANRGKLDCLKYLVANNCPRDLKSEINACNGAALNKHLNVLIYLKEELHCEWDWTTLNNGVHSGDINIIKYAFENGCPWNEEICETAVKRGNLDVLKYIRANGCPWNKEICKISTKNIEFLKYAHENGCPWDKKTCEMAVKKNNLDCLKYAHENGCPWDHVTCEIAAEESNLECLKYLVDNNCPWSQSVCEKSITSNNVDFIKYVLDTNKIISKNQPSQNEMYQWHKKHLTSIACLNCDPEILIFLIKNGETVLQENFIYSIYNQNLGCLKYLLTNYRYGKESNICEIYNNAAFNGRIDSMECISDHLGYYPWDKNTFTKAAANLKSFTYLHNLYTDILNKNNKNTYNENANNENEENKNCENKNNENDNEYKNKIKNFNFLCEGWNEGVYYWSFSHKNSDMVKYLHLIGCPWSKNTFDLSLELAMGNYEGIYKNKNDIKTIPDKINDRILYLFDNGCPINNQLKNKNKILLWIMRNHNSYYFKYIVKDICDVIQLYF